MSNFVSAGVIGSYARSELAATSDIDFYVVFDPAGPTESLREDEMSETVCELIEHVRRSHPDEPFADRFSVYWSTLQSLRDGQYDVGRWPAYDRRAFLNGGEHMVGTAISKESLARVSHRAVVVDSARFLLEVVRQKLQGLLGAIDRLDEEGLQRLGPVVLTKAVTMPVRMLYVLHPISDAQLIVSTEVAVAECEKMYAKESWWPLVAAALQWRQSPPLDRGSWREGLVLLRTHLKNLYVSCIGAYADELGRDEADVSQRLRDWQKELRKAFLLGTDQPN